MVDENFGFFRANEVEGNSIYTEHVKNNEIKFRRQSWRHYQGMEINASSNEIKVLSCMNEHS